MWYGKRAVTKAIDLHYEGLSTRKVAGHFVRHERFKPSWTSIWRWIYKFGRFVKRFVAKLRPKLSERWQADEMCLFIKGEPYWNWEGMDEETRFWLASRLSEGWDRGIDDAEAMLRLARETAKGKPAVLVRAVFLRTKRQLLGSWLAPLQARTSGAGAIVKA